MRFLLVLAVLCCGCSNASAITLKEKCRLGAWLALHVAKPTGASPAPTPDTGDLCPDCGGTGILPGDGKVRPMCKTCNGTGKKTKENQR
jgi:hypothetical protein